jgi:hypothetical protein
LPLSASADSCVGKLTIGSADEHVPPSGCFVMGRKKMPSGFASRRGNCKKSLFINMLFGKYFVCFSAVLLWHENGITARYRMSLLKKELTT